MDRPPSPLKLVQGHPQQRGPTPMTDRQMTDYLKGLRENRPQRPSGSRPPPASSTKRHSLLRDSISSAAAPDTHDAPSRCSSALSYYNYSDSSSTSSPRWSHVTLESERDPAAKLRQRELEEARSIRRTLESLGSNSRQDSRSASHSSSNTQPDADASREADRLIWKHQNPHAPFRVAEHPAKPRNFASMSSSQSVQARVNAQQTHQKQDSLDLDDLLDDYSPADDYKSDGTAKTATPVEPETPVQGDEALDLDLMRKMSAKGWAATGHDSDTSEDQSLSRRLSSKLSLSKLGSRSSRKTSGAKRVSPTNNTRDSFPNSDERIYEDATAIAAPDEVPTHVRRNPFARARGEATALSQRLWHRTEIHKNEPTQSRNPDYTRNDPVFGTDKASPKSSSSDDDPDEPKFKHGLEVRSNELRAATSRRVGDRSNKLPSPAIVSDKPGRPIVSFDPNWKAKDTDKDTTARPVGSPGSSLGRSHTLPPSQGLPSTPTSNSPPLPTRSKTVPLPDGPQPSIFELLGEESPEVLGIDRFKPKQSPSITSLDSVEGPPTPGDRIHQPEMPVRHRQMPSITIGGAAGEDDRRGPASRMHDADSYFPPPVDKPAPREVPMASPPVERGLPPQRWQPQQQQQQQQQYQPGREAARRSAQRIPANAPAAPRELPTATQPHARPSNGPAAPAAPSILIDEAEDEDPMPTPRRQTAAPTIVVDEDITPRKAPPVPRISFNEDDMPRRSSQPTMPRIQVDDVPEIFVDEPSAAAGRGQQRPVRAPAPTPRTNPARGSRAPPAPRAQPLPPPPRPQQQQQQQQQRQQPQPQPRSAPASQQRHLTPAVPLNQALCAQCALPISGKIVGAAGARFHPECFVCYQCSERLECVAFYPEPNERREERLARMEQRAAGEDVPAPEGVSVDDDMDDSLRFYCHLDFHELFSPRCKSCKTPIEGEVVVACGAEWHVGHFFCAQCGDPFDSSTPYVEKDGYAWCVKCHHERFSSKCSRCRRPITDRVLKALGTEWHVQCFCCDECGSEFPDGKFLLREMNGHQGTVCVGCEERRLKA